MRKKLLSTLGVTIFVVLTLGVSNDPNSYVGKTNTLNPPPYVSTPAPIVEATVVRAPAPVRKAVGATSGGSTVGYAGMGGQCTDYIRMVAPGLAQNGNAGTWRANSSTPTIGSVMIWRPGQMGANSYFGHVALVVGIKSNGMIVVKHWNWPNQTIFPSTGNFAT